MSKKRIKFLNSKNPLVKFGLGVLKGSTITTVSVIAIFGIVIAISTFVHAGSLTPPGAPASTQMSVYEKTDIRGPRAMSAEASARYYAAAAQYCYGLSAAAAVAIDGDTSTTYTDWRLPTAEEAGVFSGTITSTNVIWTSTVTSNGNSTSGSWVAMNISGGSWNYVNVDTNGNAYVRCVR